jgi:hypothetical protein
MVNGETPYTLSIAGANVLLKPVLKEEKVTNWFFQALVIF